MRSQKTFSQKWKKRWIKLKGLFFWKLSLFLFKYTRLNTWFLKKKIRSLGVKKIHVGCGDVILDDWLNIKYERREFYGVVHQQAGKMILNYNLAKIWPFDDNSIDFLAGSHFIEHLDLNNGIEFCKKAYRVLKKGGVIRLSCPDLEIYIDNYAKKNQEFFTHPLIRRWCAFENAKTPGEILAAKAYDSGNSHHWFYDFDSLKHILEAAGFRDIKRCQRLEGQTPDLAEFELKDRELETVYIEAVK